MREKIDGVSFLGATIAGNHFVFGNYWLNVEFPYDQLELVPQTNEFRVLYPRIEGPIMDNGHYFQYHEIVPYDREVLNNYKEGVMLFVQEEEGCREYRVKRVNTVEVEVVDGKLFGDAVQVKDGVWEVSYDGKQFHFIRERPMKQPTLRPLEQIYSSVVLSDLDDWASHPVRWVWGPGLPDHYDRADKMFHCQWKRFKGTFENGVFHFSLPQAEMASKRRQKVVVRGKKSTEYAQSGHDAAYVSAFMDDEIGDTLVATVIAVAGGAVSVKHDLSLPSCRVTDGDIEQFVTRCYGKLGLSFSSYSVQQNVLVLHGIFPGCRMMGYEDAKRVFPPQYAIYYDKFAEVVKLPVNYFGAAVPEKQFNAIVAASRAFGMTGATDAMAHAQSFDLEELSRILKISRGLSFILVSSLGLLWDPYVKKYKYSV
jgi:hypothetical protein